MAEKVTEIWEKEARTSAKKSTRFLNLGAHIPSSRILSALEDAAQSSPPSGPPSLTILPNQMRCSEAEEVVWTGGEYNSEAFAVRLETDSMSLG